MYSKQYRIMMERGRINVDWCVIEDKGLPPPQVLEVAEAGSAIERLLREAVTPEEHTLLCLIDAMVDEAWKFDTGKALRGELRRLFTGCGRGYSERRFYAAFHGIEKRMGV